MTYFEVTKEEHDKVLNDLKKLQDDYDKLLKAYDVVMNRRVNERRIVIDAVKALQDITSSLYMIVK